MCHIFFIHSSVNGHLGCFHVLAIINRAAMNTVVHDSVWIMPIFSDCLINRRAALPSQTPKRRSGFSLSLRCSSLRGLAMKSPSKWSMRRIELWTQGQGFNSKTIWLLIPLMLPLSAPFTCLEHHFTIGNCPVQPYLPASAFIWKSDTSQEFSKCSRL